MTKALIFLRAAHQKYQSNLSHFERYIIFKYTLQSWQVNEFLTGVSSKGAGDKQINVIIWTRDFFYNYNLPVYGSDAVQAPYNNWIRFFRSPDAFLPQTVRPEQVAAYIESRFEEANRTGKFAHSFEEMYDIAEAVMRQYIRDLQQIILSAPRTPKAFAVYKGSTAYPGVPKDQPLNGPVTLPQTPFNSTSYDPAFNYGAFIAEEDHWLLWSLHVGPNVPCLILSDLVHALPFEQEVLFPPGIKFRITSSKLAEMDYISKEQYMKEAWRQVQKDRRRPLVGPVFLLSTDFTPVVKKKVMHLLEASIVTTK